MPESRQKSVFLISACLLGERVRYDGKSRPLTDPRLIRAVNEGRAVAVCPEVLGNLPVPRPPCEIANGASSRDILARKAKITDQSGADFTLAYVSGALKTLDAARSRGARAALLKESSPSCGSHRVHDGTFTRRKIPGQGVAARLLEDAGVRVFSEHELDAFFSYVGS